MCTQTNEGSICIKKKVLDAAARSYRIDGLDDEDIFVDNLKETVSLFIPKLRRIENVWSKEHLNRSYLDEYQKYKQLGIEIWVLVPASNMGEAHSYLRGHVDRIQSWWSESDDIKFGWPEKP